jgi:hypothetical protein
LAHSIRGFSPWLLDCCFWAWGEARAARKGSRERERERERESEPTKVFLTEKGSSKHEKVMHEVEDMAGSAYREGRQYKTLTETGVKRLLFLCYKRIPQC